VKKSNLTRMLRFALSIQILLLCVLPYARGHSNRFSTMGSLPQTRAAYLVVCGDASSDVSQINASTLNISTQAGTIVKPTVTGLEYRDVNGDGIPDLLVRLNEDYSTLRETKGLLTGSTYSGVPVTSNWYLVERDTERGSILAMSAGSIQVVQPTCTLGPFTRAFRTDVPVAGRLIPNGIASSCGVVKPCPGTEITLGTPGPDFNSFQDTFRTNMSTVPVCITVLTTAVSCASGVHTTAIVGNQISFLDMCEGYVGDSGVGTGTAGTTTFSFNVPPGQLYSLVFTGETPGIQCAEFTYTISISPCTVRCVQDDTTGDLITFGGPDSGFWQFRSCRFPGFTLTGAGTATRKGSVVTLTDYESLVRVVAQFDESTKRGSASIFFSPFNFSARITDRNITDNTCQCRNP
jgi:hypothetical protein